MENIYTTMHSGAPAIKVNHFTKFKTQPKALARTSEGHPLFRYDDDSIKRYVYEDETMDPNSTVDPRLPSVYDIRQEGGANLSVRRVPDLEKIRLAVTRERRSRFIEEYAGNVAMVAN